MSLFEIPEYQGELKMKTRAIVLYQNGDADQMVWEDVDLPNFENVYFRRIVSQVGRQKCPTF